MDNIPTTNVTAERFDRHARNGLADEAPDHKEDLRLAGQYLLWGLQHLRDAGADADRITYIAGCVHDAITKRDEVLNRDLDAAGRWADAVDLSELEGVIAR
jgi:hypothetical protein